MSDGLISAYPNAHQPVMQAIQGDHGKWQPYSGLSSCSDLQESTEPQADLMSLWSTMCRQLTSLQGTEIKNQDAIQVKSS